MPEYDAVVVGAGPNGLAAATTLAGEGASVLVVEAQETIGGGCRSEELTLPGFVHDTCSAIHPLGIASPYFRSLPLHEHGLEWVHPEVACAHVLDGGRAGLLLRDVDATGRANGDVAGWRRLLGPVVDRWDGTVESVLAPPVRLPPDPAGFAQFALRAPWPARLLGAAVLRGERSKALFAGISAHAIAPLEAPLTAAGGVILTAAAPGSGWPVAKGGSQKIADALVSVLAERGGKVETGRPVTSLDELPSSKVTLLDVTPWQLADIAADRLPHRYRERLRRVRHAWASFKVDYAIDGPVPWTNADARRAGTVHVGGTAAEVAASERAVARGGVSDRPFVLVGQQSIADPTRAPAGKHTLWTYCHMPLGWTGDATDLIEAQIERFAPGFRELVLARSVRGPADLEANNANHVGGDITGGAPDGLQLLFRPTLTARPYRTPVPGVFLCSSSTPPGPAVHGMCGHYAARAALRSM